MKIFYEKLPYNFQPHYEDHVDPMAVVDTYQIITSSWERAYFFPLELPMFKPQIDCLAQARNICKSFMNENSVLKKPTLEAKGNALWWILMLHTLTAVNSASNNKNLLIAFSDASVGFLSTNNEINIHNAIEDRPDWLKSAMVAFEMENSA